MTNRTLHEAGPAAHHRPREVCRGACWGCMWGFLVAVFLIGSPARAEDAFLVREEGWEGCSELWRLANRELGSSRVRAVASLDYSKLEPSDAVVFIHPQAEIRFQALAAFLSAGGRAAVIDDFGRADGLWRRFHILRKEASGQPALRVNGRAALAVAVPAARVWAREAPGHHETLSGVDQVVTNHPSALELESGVELTPLLAIPLEGGGGDLLAVTGVIGDARDCGLTGESVEPGARCGRLFAMSDPSVFINLMLRYPGNRRFAQGLVRYLVEDDAWGAREGTLYVLSGRFHQTGSYDGEARFSDHWQEARTRVEEWAEEIRRDGLPPPLSITLAALLVLGVSAWAFTVAAHREARLRPNYARPVPLVSQGGTAGRFAVLASETTDRAHLLMEMQRSLEAVLRQRLGLGPRASAQEIRDRGLATGALDAVAASALDGLLLRLKEGERAFSSRRKLTMSDRALRALDDEVLDILGGMKHPRVSSL